MNFVAVYKASPIIPEQPVESVTIIINAEAPDWSDVPLGEVQERWGNDGERVAHALWAALPGATIDALLGALLRRRAVMLRVPMPDEVSI